MTLGGGALASSSQALTDPLPSTDLHGSENIPFFPPMLLFKHDVSFPDKAIAEKTRTLFLEFTRQVQTHLYHWFCLFDCFFFKVT